MSLKMFKKILKRTLITIFVIAVLAFVNIHILGNFYQIDENAFRSGQLNKHNLEYYLKKHKIKTILNFRGENLWDENYLDEKRISKELNVNLIDYSISNGTVLSSQKTAELVNIIKKSKKPILMHCWGGADRTALAAALYQYAVAKTSVEEARKEFNWWYGHIPLFREHVIAMDKTFDNYLLETKK